jgi:hypothetical protein
VPILKAYHCDWAVSWKLHPSGLKSRSARVTASGHLRRGDVDGMSVVAPIAAELLR